jgi:hypothetical protein|tara:strand:+ start:60 stop:245 length:186 start_codon:yes stop_codon:yes gene_type:complete
MNKASTVNDTDCEMESSLHSCIEYFRGRELFKKDAEKLKELYDNSSIETLVRDFNEANLPF